MKYFEPTYLIILSASIAKWLVSGVDLMSKLLALLVGFMTAIYMYYKIENLVIDNKIKKRKLKDCNDSED